MKSSKPKFPRLYLLLAYDLTWLFWFPVALSGLLLVCRGLRLPWRNQ